MHASRSNSCRQATASSRRDPEGGVGSRCKSVDKLVLQRGNGEALYVVNLFASRKELASEVLNDWNLLLVIAIEILSEELDMVIVYAVQDLLDRLVDDRGVLGSHRALQDASAANILINDRFKVLRLPK